MYEALQGVLSGLHVLAALAGLGVSVFHLGRSRWVALLAAAFTLQAFTVVSYRVLLFLVTRGTLSYDALQPAYGLLGLLGVLATIALVAGVAMVLRALPAR
jgi:hypothetical protein